MVRIDRPVAAKVKLAPAARAKRCDNLVDRNSNICPGCGYRLDFWACEALCHNCGLKFTCDE
ncbi:MAG: hypothetical protein GKR89_37160 [Candidatus Latescibacteria bacterium]|nr:hypothetical protein [Candidatus Latescibacterota bacterium]